MKEFYVSREHMAEIAEAIDSWLETSEAKVFLFTWEGTAIPKLSINGEAV